jgi:protein tyrosine phosphatase (PTP) superfamily phosphohydrolase (DUF442 family)
VSTTHQHRSVVVGGNVRWVFLGVLRVVYRGWTRVAAHLFPEDSTQAHLAERIGIPLPDRLNMSWVTPQLAVGGRVLPVDIPLLRQQGIGAVIDTRSEHRDDEVALNTEGILLLYLPTPDTFPLSVSDLQTGADWALRQITDARKVLIHCEHGVGRSVLLTAAVLVAQGYDAHSAISLVQRQRWQAAPNHRQLVRLLEFEHAERARTTDSARA